MNVEAHAFFFAPLALPRSLMQAGRSSEPTDFGRLIQLVAIARDREAFDRLFDHYAPRLKTYLRRAGATPAAAEDFAQETMLIVWRKAALFDPARAGASAWIFTIARNLRIDALRMQKRAIEDVDASDDPDAPAPPDVLMIERDTASRIRQALDGLSEEQARVVQLSFFSDKPHAEIARDLNVPLGTVKSRLRLAMLRLRALLADSQ